VGKPIEKILSEGQPLLVQVLKDPIGTKGARLSTQVSIAGRLVVYLPQDPHIGISQRIEDETERQLLRERLAQILPADETGGFIIRTVAESATDAELRADVEYLRKLWHGIRGRAFTSPAPALLYQDLSLAQRVLRDIAGEGTGRIVVDSRENFQKLQAFAEEYSPAVLAKLEHYTGERPLFDLFNVEDEIERALASDDVLDLPAALLGRLQGGLVRVGAHGCLRWFVVGPPGRAARARKARVVPAPGRPRASRRSRRAAAPGLPASLRSRGSSS